MKVGQNIMLAPGLVKQQDKASAEAKARQLLDRVGLAEKFQSRELIEFLNWLEETLRFLSFLPVTG